MSATMRRLVAKWAPRTTLATVISAEGARIGIVSCLECGAALMIDPRDDFDNISTHMTWHEAQRTEATS